MESEPSSGSSSRKRGLYRASSRRGHIRDALLASLRGRVPSGLSPAFARDRVPLPVDCGSLAPAFPRRASRKEATWPPALEPSSETRRANRSRFSARTTADTRRFAPRMALRIALQVALRITPRVAVQVISRVTPRVTTRITVREMATITSRVMVQVALQTAAQVTLNIARQVSPRVPLQVMCRTAIGTTLGTVPGATPKATRPASQTAANPRTYPISWPSTRVSLIGLMRRDAPDSDAGGPKAAPPGLLSTANCLLYRPPVSTTFRVFPSPSPLVPSPSLTKYTPGASARTSFVP